MGLRNFYTTFCAMTETDTGTVRATEEPRHAYCSGEGVVGVFYAEEAKLFYSPSFGIDTAECGDALRAVLPTGWEAVEFDIWYDAVLFEKKFCSDVYERMSEAIGRDMFLFEEMAALRVEVAKRLGYVGAWVDDDVFEARFVRSMMPTVTALSDREVEAILEAEEDDGE